MVANGKSSSARPLRVALLSSVLTVLGLIGLELVLREAAGAEPREFTFESTFPTLASDRLLVEHPTRFYTLASNSRFAEEHLGRYATGDWPFRGRPPSPAPEGIRRIAVLGDSCIYGTGLDPADTLPYRLQTELALRGLGPDRVQVLNFGVPGYSTVQIRLLLEEVLREWRPEVVVLYPAAWNDQAPAMGRSDVELAERLGSFGTILRRTALARLLRGQLDVEPSGPSVPDGGGPTVQEIVQAWDKGAPLFGARVPEHALEDELSRILESCARRGATPVVIAPAHPEKTAGAHPRTRRDAATVIRVAGEHSLTALDAQAVVETALSADNERFLDFVHLSPAAVDALAALVAESVWEELDPGSPGKPPGSAIPRIARVLPATAPLLGDVSVRVELAADLGEELPVVVVGGAPLMGLRRVDARTFEGTLFANSAGRHGVLLQSVEGCAWFPEAVELVAPTVSLGDEELSVRSRPGDLARIYFAAKRHEVPLPTLNGPYALVEADRFTRAFGVVCGEDGVGSIALPPEAEGARGTVHVQALVLPGGVPPDMAATRWSEIATFVLE